MRYSLLSFLFLFIGMTMSLSSFAQRSQVLGSMPKDGADGLLRNVVIAVGVDFANDKIGFDPKTLTTQNIRLYPSDRPQISIESFVIADENNASLIIEPSQLLAPNTLYTFEISQGLRDQAGNSFGPYKIQFKTGAKSIPKHISTDRPKIVHQARTKYWQPKPEIFVEPAIAERSVKTSETQLSEEAIPIATKTEAEIPKKADNPENISVPQNANETATIASTDEKVAEKNQSEESVAINEPERSAEAETKIEEIEENQEMVASIDFPTAQISLKGKLPVRFSLPDNSPIQYIVKNTRGEVVKKGSGKLLAGKHEKFLSMSDLPAGRYQILIKTNGVRQKHVFEIQ